MPMDLSSLMGGGKPPEQESTPPAVEYTAQADSSLISGEVKLTVGEEGLAVVALFDAIEIPYADMGAIALIDYVVGIHTQEGGFAFSRMGSWCQPFYDALVEAYNKKVLKALFVAGDPALSSKGTYRYAEHGTRANGMAPVRVYENCVCVLPPNMEGRRVPLCFLSAMDKGDYELTLHVGADQSYTFGKLGYDTAPFADAVEKQIRGLREKSLAVVREIDPALSAAQAAQIARLMPEGAAAPIGRLAEIAPSFVSAVETKIAAGRAAETYAAFRELCDPMQIHVGIKKSGASGGEGEGGDGGSLAGMPGGDFAGMLGGGSPMGALAGGLPGSDVDSGEGPAHAAPADPYMLWLIAPAPGGNACAVEFAGAAGEAAATFIYRFEGGFEGFARQLNIALEAIGFKREVIRLSDEELKKPENMDYRMAVQRNAALRFIRGCFGGRVIHNSAWKRKLQELWGEGPAREAPAFAADSDASGNAAANAGGRYCTACGAVCEPGIKFCGQCGAKAG